MPSFSACGSIREWHETLPRIDRADTVGLAVQHGLRALHARSNRSFERPVPTAPLATNGQASWCTRLCLLGAHARGERATGALLANERRAS
jgi:hypothetical protein